MDGCIEREKEKKRGREKWDREKNYGHCGYTLNGNGQITVFMYKERVRRMQAYARSTVILYYILGDFISRRWVLEDS